jgi:toxin YoeB
MVTWQVILSRQATKDAQKLARAGYQPQTEQLLKLFETNPYLTPPPYEKLVGDLRHFYSRRITIPQRLVYRVLEADRIVHVLRMWSHYE